MVDGNESCRKIQNDQQGCTCPSKSLLRPSVKATKVVSIPKPGHIEMAHKQHPQHGRQQIPFHAVLAEPRCVGPLADALLFTEAGSHSMKVSSPNEAVPIIHFHSRTHPEDEQPDSPSGQHRGKGAYCPFVGAS